MIYAIQGNAVRWFLTEQEDEHLFANFGLMSNITLGVHVDGDWIRGLRFIATADKRHRGPGDYVVITAAGSHLRTIVTPVDEIQLPRESLATVQKTASVESICEKSSGAVVVFPTKVITLDEEEDDTEDLFSQTPPANTPIIPPAPTPIPTVIVTPPPDHSPPSDTAVSQMEQAPESTSEHVDQPPTPILEPVVEIASEDSGSTQENDQRKDHSADMEMAILLVGEINKILSRYPSIVAKTSGKEIQFGRYVINRKVIA